MTIAMSESEKRRLSAPVIAFSLSLLLSAISAAVTPPFQTPDEPAHFVRAFAVSRGELVAVTRGGGGGSLVPRDAALLISEWMYLPPGGRVRETYTREHFRRSLELEPARELTFVPLASGRLPSRINGNGASYVPHAHAVPALATSVFRAAGAPAIVTFYGMRLANALVSSLLIALAVATAPSYRWSLTMVALLPMAISLRGSVNPDAMILAAALVAAALVWRMAVDGYTHRMLFGLLAASAFMISLKPPYLVVSAAFFLLPRGRFPSLRTHVTSAITLAIIVSGSTYAFLAWSAARVAAPASPVVVRAGWRTVAADPLPFLRDMGYSLSSHGIQFLGEITGKLGWLNVQMPPGTMPALFVVLLFVSLLHSGRRLPSLLRYGSVVLAIGGVFLICLALYAHAPISRRGVDGVQGRYFLPLLPLLFPLLRIERLMPAQDEVLARRFVVAAALVSNTVAFVVVARAFS